MAILQVCNLCPLLRARFAICVEDFDALRLECEKCIWVLDGREDDPEVLEGLS